MPADRTANNPINALTRILGDLHDDRGRVRIPGFYDGVAELPPGLAAQWDALGFDEGAMLGAVGLSTPSGEVGRPALERLWARPTADLNGIWGGYTGAGSKTVIPAEAHAKLSCRLVPGQDPAAVLAGLRQFVTERAPPGARVAIQDFNSSPGVAVPVDGPFIAAAVAALTEEYGKAPVMMGCGGSIPVVGSLRSLLGFIARTRSLTGSASRAARGASPDCSASSAASAKGRARLPQYGASSHLFAAEAERMR